MQPDSATVAPMKATARSRVTNGSAVLPDVDGRSTWVRRLRDLIGLHLSDLGGEDAVSEAERSIIGRAAKATATSSRFRLTETRVRSATQGDQHACPRAHPARPDHA
jgi:hypothetical protein